MDKVHAQIETKHLIKKDHILQKKRTMMKMTTELKMNRRTQKKMISAKRNKNMMTKSFLALKGVLRRILVHLVQLEVEVLSVERSKMIKMLLHVNYGRKW
jgi:hypothetical protein